MKKKGNQYTIALVAHDECKKDLAEWVAFNKKKLSKHNIVSTGTTGRMVEEEINKGISTNSREYITVSKLKSGPLGGDQQLGAKISEKQIDILIFFWDPMQPQPHDVDVKALLRISALYNIPTATNRSTADFVITSSLFHKDYEPIVKDYSEYIKRSIPEK